MALSPKVTRNAVSLWEQGQGITQANLLAIAVVTGVFFEWLATGRGPRLSTQGNADAIEPLTNRTDNPSQDEPGNKEIRPMKMGTDAVAALKLLRCLSREEAFAVIGAYADELRDKPAQNPMRRA